MSKARTCPVCGGATLAGRDWHSFWTGSAACAVCGAPLQFRRGWRGYAAHTTLQAMAAAAAYLAAREFPGLWGLAGFLAVFLPLATGLLALAQWYRWRGAELAPAAGRPPGGRAFEPVAAADGRRDAGS